MVIKMYFTYVLQCADGSYYTGFAKHLNRRMHEHAEKLPQCARYTRTHGAVALAALWASGSRSEACRLESLIKTLTRVQKEALFAQPEALGRWFEGKIDGQAYAPRPRVTLADCLNGSFEEGRE
jgi:putative endonuclease